MIAALSQGINNTTNNVTKHQIGKFACSTPKTLYVQESYSISSTVTDNEKLYCLNLFLSTLEKRNLCKNDDGSLEVPSTAKVLYLTEELPPLKKYIFWTFSLAI